MKKILLVVAILSCASATGAETLAYSFETVTPAGPDGFFGLGATVTQEPTIGVTHLDNSLKYEIASAGFVGARTETVIPPQLNDPPGVSYVLLDLTITAAYAGSFATLGITVFGHALNANGGPQFGLQVQFTDTVPISGLVPGTYTDLRIDLDASAGPYRPGESFNDIFGPGENDLTIASAFQFFVSKNADIPLTFYLDNVRLVADEVPEPTAGWFLGAGAGAMGIAARRRHLLISN